MLVNSDYTCLSLVQVCVIMSWRRAMMSWIRAMENQSQAHVYEQKLCLADQAKRTKHPTLNISIPPTSLQDSVPPLLHIPKAFSHPLNPSLRPYHNARTPPPPHARDPRQRHHCNPNLLLLPRPSHRRHRKSHPRHNESHIQVPHHRGRSDASVGMVHNNRSSIVW